MCLNNSRDNAFVWNEKEISAFSSKSAMLINCPWLSDKAVIYSHVSACECQLIIHVGISEV